MDDLGADSDASALTDLDELELRWTLHSPPLESRDSPAVASPPDASAEDAAASATSHNEPAPISASATGSGSAQSRLKSSSPLSTSRPDSAVSRRRATVDSSRAVARERKRSQRAETAPKGEDTTSEPRATGADGTERLHRARKRTRLCEEAAIDEAVAEVAGSRAELDGAATQGIGKRALGRTRQPLREPADERTPQSALRLSAELRMLKRDYFAVEPGAADTPRSTRRASLPVKLASVTEVPLALAVSLLAPTSIAVAPDTPYASACRVTRRSSAAAALAVLPHIHAGTEPHASPHPSAVPPPSMSVSPAAPPRDEVEERGSDAPLSKRQRKEVQRGAAAAALDDASTLPAATSIAGLPPRGVPPDTSIAVAATAVLAAAVLAAADALPARRAHKTPKRYVDEMDAQLIHSQSAAARAKQRVRLPGLEAPGGLDGFLTTRVSVRDPSPFTASTKQAVRIQPQDPEASRREMILPATLPPLPLLLSAVKPLAAGPSRAAPPPPPPRLSAPADRPCATASSTAKPTKARARHPALDSRQSWVPVERDLRITLAGKPPIWCQGRQELCESLEYFRSYQGGHYDNQERCLGYLLDGFPSPSDACAAQGKVINSHGGGCSEVLATGYRLRASQTREGMRVRALTNCMQTGTPVVLLAGAMYEHFPRLKDMGEDGVRYAVLGHYLVTDIWAEGEPVEGAEDDKYFVRFKVRFEWLASQGTPWFADVIGKNSTDSTAASSARETAPPASPVIFPAPVAAPVLASNPAAVPPPPAPPLPIAASSSAPAATKPPVNPLVGLRFQRIVAPPTASPPDLVDDGSDMDISSGASASSPPPMSPGSDCTVDSGFVDVTATPSGEEQTVRCASCGDEHKCVYREAVECYNEECDRFFQINGAIPAAGSLTYRTSFLSLTPDLPSSDLVPQPLGPRTLQSLSGTSQISDFSFLAWRGFGCSVCGRLSSRGEWYRLVCSGCGAETDATARVFAAAELEGKGKGKGRALDSGPTFLLAPYASTRIEGVPGYEGYSVELSPADGSGVARVHHLWPVEMSSMKEADRLFKEYQGHEAGALFRRNKLARHCAAGALLCQQFTFNAGERYAHAVSTATYPFAPTTAAPPDHENADTPTTYAPTCARDARDYLEMIVRTVVGDDPETNFNEILSVAYMTGGKMNYHDDGERGLGQFVASVSLGAPAVMTFRAKAKKLRRRPAQKGEEEDADADDENERKISTADSGKSRVVLKARLQHGHVLIMEGADMQKLFEHKVEPAGLRFAATARWVGPDHLRPRSKASLRQPAATPNAPTSRFAYQDPPRPPASLSSQSRAPAVIPPPVPRTAPKAQPVSSLPPILPTASTTPLPPLALPISFPAFPSLPPTHPDLVIAASLGLRPHDKRVRHQPRAHPRRDALPSAQLLHPPYPYVDPPAPSPGRGVPIGLPTMPPDAHSYTLGRFAAPLAPGVMSRAANAVSTSASSAGSYAGWMSGSWSASATGPLPGGGAHRWTHPATFRPGQ